MAAGFAGWLIGVTGGEVLILSGACGWWARRVIRSQDLVRAKLIELSTYIAVDKAVGPRVERDISDLKELTVENTAKIVALVEWKRGHDMWHERHVQEH